MDAAPTPTAGAMECLAVAARCHGVDADPRRLRHELGAHEGAATLCDLQRLARWLGLDARVLAREPEDLDGIPVPAIARLGDGGFLVLAGVRDAAVLVHDPALGRWARLARESFAARWAGELLLLRRRGGAATTGARPVLGWFLAEIARHRRPLAEVLAASVVLQVLALATPLTFQVVIDKVLVHHGLTTLGVLATGLLAACVFEALLGWLRAYLLAHTGSRIDVALGAGLFRHLLRLPLGYFEARRTGDVVARVRELETVRACLTGASVTLLVDCVFTVVFLAVLYLYSPALTAVVAASVVLYVLIAAAVTPVLRARLDTGFVEGAEVQAFLVETVAAAPLVKAAAVEPHMRRGWEDRLAAYVRARLAASLWGQGAGQAATLINRLSAVAILWLGARMVIDGRLSVGQLVAFNMIAMRIGGPLLRLTQLWQEFLQTRVALARLRDVLEARPEPDGAGRGMPARLRGAVRLEDVGFRYRPEDDEVLRGVTLAIAPGEVVGLVGPSGCGKSTLVRLLQRLYVPQRGRVRIDGLDLALVDVAWLRRQVALVPQEGRVLNRSVRENIALANPAMGLERVMHAARLAGAHDFVTALPEGYDTVVGEQGTALSGGQCQRLAIARALAGDPRVLILDESTSALDFESERQVHRHMRHICRGRTVIIVAHRPSAVRGADRIVVMEAGRITEIGTPAELRARGGYFARMHGDHAAVAGAAP